MRKTKIIATVGPSSNNEDTLAEMHLAGMNVARLNFSHASHKEHKQNILTIKKIRQKNGLPLCIMLDTKGPEIRIRRFKNNSIFLEENQEFVLTAKEIDGDNTIVSVTYAHLPDEVEPGDEILLNDALIKLQVTKTDKNTIYTKVLEGGILRNNQSINIPGRNIKLPTLNEIDKSDIIFGLENGIDAIAQSFVRNKDDVLTLRKFIKQHSSDPIFLIAKIENREGVQNIEEITDVCDGIMVARGDLGVELPLEEVPIIQKRIISIANQKAKPVITATEMLESMIHAPRPTRAEVNDVANAIFDGSDAIMLSGETAAGKYPVEAVKMMASIASRADKEDMKNVPPLGKGTHECIAHSSVESANALKSSAIITPTETGYTARLVAKYRPQAIIYAIVYNEKIERSLLFSKGVIPIIAKREENFSIFLNNIIHYLLSIGVVHKADSIITTAGLNPDNNIYTDCMHIIYI